MTARAKKQPPAVKEAERKLVSRIFKAYERGDLGDGDDGFEEAKRRLLRVTASSQSDYAIFLRGFPDGFDVCSLPPAAQEMVYMAARMRTGRLAITERKFCLMYDLLDLVSSSDVVAEAS
jgi:hypothetical protein